MKTNYYISTYDEPSDVVDVYQFIADPKPDKLVLTFSTGDEVEGVCQSFVDFLNNLSREQGR